LDSWSVVTAGEEQTRRLGEKLGKMLPRSALILLQGDLGAGKTVFARGVARGLGVPPDIPITSPTFTLMNHYTARHDLYHFDLYRLADSDELIELGFDEYAFGPGVALVEWPEKLENNELPGLWVKIQRLDDERRKIEFFLQDVDNQIVAAVAGVCQ